MSVGKTKLCLMSYSVLLFLFTASSFAGSDMKSQIKQYKLENSSKFMFIPLLLDNPNPVIEKGPHDTTIDLGQSVTLSVRARNSGGDAASGGITMSFPQLNGSGDTSMVSNAGSFGQYVERAKGSSIYHKNGTQITASYLMVEAADRWSAGSSKTLNVTFTPRKAGSYTVYFRSAMSADGTGNWIGAPSGGKTDQQGWNVYEATITVKQAAEPPKPVIEKGPHDTTIDLGQSVTLSVRARNSGGDAASGGITMSFPQLTGFGDTSMVGNAGSFGRYVEKAKGSSIYHKNGNQITASYLMVEAADRWSAGSTKTLNVTFTPTKAGTYTVYYRTAMSTNGIDSWTGAPISGRTDQQGWNVSSCEIEVNGKETEKGELIVTISPLSAKNAGARWLLKSDGTERKGGDKIELIPGKHIIEFKSLDGWIAPNDVEVEIEKGLVSKINGPYQEKNKNDPPPTPLLSAEPQEISEGDSFTLNWDDVGDSYTVEGKNKSQNIIYLKEDIKQNYDIVTLENSGEFTFRVKAEANGIESDKSNRVYVTVNKKPQKLISPKINAPAKKKSGIGYFVTWDHVENANEYSIKELDESGKVTFEKRGSDRKYIFKNENEIKDKVVKFTYEVIAHADGFEDSDKASVSVAIEAEEKEVDTPKAIEINSVDSPRSGDDATLEWSRVSGSTYRIECRFNGDDLWEESNINDTSHKFNLSSHGKFSLRVFAQQNGWESKPTKWVYLTVHEVNDDVGISHVKIDGNTKHHKYDPGDRISVEIGFSFSDDLRIKRFDLDLIVDGTYVRDDLIVYPNRLDGNSETYGFILPDTFSPGKYKIEAAITNIDGTDKNSNNNAAKSQEFTVNAPAPPAKPVLEKDPIISTKGVQISWLCTNALGYDIYLNGEKIDFVQDSSNKGSYLFETNRLDYGEDHDYEIEALNAGDKTKKSDEYTFHFPTLSELTLPFPVKISPKDNVEVENDSENMITLKHEMEVLDSSADHNGYSYVIWAKAKYFGKYQSVGNYNWITLQDGLVHETRYDHDFGFDPFGSQDKILWKIEVWNLPVADFSGLIGPSAVYKKYEFKLYKHGKLKPSNNKSKNVSFEEDILISGDNSRNKLKRYLKDNWNVVLVQAQNLSEVNFFPKLTILTSLNEMHLDIDDSRWIYDYLISGGKLIIMHSQISTMNEYVKSLLSDTGYIGSTLDMNKGSLEIVINNMRYDQGFKPRGKTYHVTFKESSKSLIQIINSKGIVRLGYKHRDRDTVLAYTSLTYKNIPRKYRGKFFSILIEETLK